MKSLLKGLELSTTIILLMLSKKFQRSTRKFWSSFPSFALYLMLQNELKIRKNCRYLRLCTEGNFSWKQFLYWSLHWRMGKQLGKPCRALHKLKIVIFFTVLAHCVMLEDRASSRQNPHIIAWHHQQQNKMKTFFHFDYRMSSADRVSHHLKKHASCVYVLHWWLNIWCGERLELGLVEIQYYVPTKYYNHFSYIPK